MTKPASSLRWASARSSSAWKRPALGVQDFQVAGHPALVSHLGDLASVSEGIGEQFLLLAKLPPLLDLDQRVGDFADRLLNCLLIPQHRFLGHGLVIVAVLFATRAFGFRPRPTSIAIALGAGAGVLYFLRARAGR